MKVVHILLFFELLNQVFSNCFLQLSYDTNDLELVTYRKVYPTFFQLTPSVNDYNDVRVDIVTRYGWTDIGLLYSSNDNFYVQV